MEENKNKNKLRLIKILDILKSETDDNHYLSTNEIATLLNNEGISSNRKTLYDDLEVLSEFYDIMKDKSSKNLYHMGQRDFDPTEIQIIVSALSTAGFISERKSLELIDKFKNTLSKYQAYDISKNIKIKNATKHTNDNVLYSLSTIMDAINTNHKIIYNYFHYDVTKEKVITQDRVATPLDLVFKNDYYYVIVFSEVHDKIINLRLDRMLDVRVSEEEASFIEYNSNIYIKKSFNMFTGDVVRVKLKVYKDLMDPVLDHFGEDIISMPLNDDYTIINVEVQESKTFYSWLVSLGDIEIIEPISTRENFKRYLNDILDKY